MPTDLQPTNNCFHITSQTKNNAIFCSFASPERSIAAIRWFRITDIIGMPPMTADSIPLRVYSFVCVFHIELSLVDER